MPKAKKFQESERDKCSSKTKKGEMKSREQRGNVAVERNQVVHNRLVSLSFSLMS